MQFLKRHWLYIHKTMICCFELWLRLLVLFTTCLWLTSSVNHRSSLWCKKCNVVWLKARANGFWFGHKFSRLHIIKWRGWEAKPEAKISTGTQFHTSSSHWTIQESPNSGLLLSRDVSLTTVSLSKSRADYMWLYYMIILAGETC